MATSSESPESSDREDFVVRGEVRGIIAREESGEGGFGYDPLFYVEQFDKTFAQMSAEEKNSISHRGEALAKFAQKIKEIYGE